MHSSFKKCVLVAVTFVLIVGCRSSKQATTPEPTNPPTTPTAENAGEFQLVGTVEQAFMGERPSVSVPSGNNLDVTPAPTVTGRETPTVDGIMRVRIEDLSDALRDRCSVQSGDRVKVFWTTETQFDQSLLSGDIESRLDGRRVGIIGSVVLNPSGDQQSADELGLTAAPASPGVTSAATTTSAPNLNAGADCVLIASQIGTSTSVIPSTSPRATRRPTATSTPTHSPSPSPTASPTASPSATPAITPGPTPT